jgi:hypothetical protein
MLLLFIIYLSNVMHQARHLASPAWLCSSLFIFVFAGPLDIESRAEETNPALTEFGGQADSLNIDHNPLNVVWNEMERKCSVFFNGIAGASISVPGLTNGWNADVTASIHGPIDCTVAMAAEYDRTIHLLEMDCHD